MSVPANPPKRDFLIEAPLMLGADEVHVWRVDLETAPNEENRLSILSADEQARAARFHFERDRMGFVSTRAILRKILGSYLATDPRTLIFKYSEKSKPSLGGSQAASGLSFNVSHSGKLSLLAFTRSRQIGVDVEQIRRNSDMAAVAARFFSLAEQEQLAAVPGEQRDEAFFRCWTRKEAYIKATGEGLSLPLHQFDVSLAPGAQNALLATRPDPHEAKRWSLCDLAVESGYQAALCVSGAGWRLVDHSIGTV